MHKAYTRGNLREREYLEDLGVDGRIILQWMFRKWYSGIGGDDLAHNRDGWQTLVNAVMSLRVP
jgi:hypothetical protein